MIRTLIEVSSGTEWDFRRQLETTLDKFGFGPKRTAEEQDFYRDLEQALSDRGLNAVELVEEIQKKKLEASQSRLKG